MEIQEIGLNDYWDVLFYPIFHQCRENMGREKIKRSKTTPPALTLKNLTGAFIVLFVGLGLSLLAFIHEHIISKVSSSLGCR